MYTPPGVSLMCVVTDCLRPVRHGELCEAHAKRRQREQVLSTPIAPTNQTPRERFLEACLRYAAADSDAEWKRSEWVLMKAGARYFRDGKAGVGRPASVNETTAAELFRTLKSVRGVARQLNATRQSVRRALGRAGVRKFRPRDAVRDPSED